MAVLRRLNLLSLHKPCTAPDHLSGLPQKVHALVEDAVAKGAKLLAGGKLPGARRGECGYASSPPHTHIPSIARLSTIIRRHGHCRSVLPPTLWW